jgi:hypothetical protein
MKHSGYLAAAFGICLMVVIFLLIKIFELEQRPSSSKREEQSHSRRSTGFDQTRRGRASQAKGNRLRFRRVHDNDTIARWQTLVCCKSFKLGVGGVRTG